MEIAAKNGHLHILQWCKTNNYSFDELTCAYATIGEQFEILEWLRSQNLPYPLNNFVYNFMLLKIDI